MKVSIEYECGETTCAIEPGKFCKFVRVSHFGTYFSCALFLGPDRANRHLEDNENGWLARCEECLKQGDKNKC